MDPGHREAGPPFYTSVLSSIPGSLAPERAYMSLGSHCGQPTHQAGVTKEAEWACWNQGLPPSLPSTVVLGVPGLH